MTAQVAVIAEQRYQVQVDAVVPPLHGDMRYTRVYHACEMVHIYEPIGNHGVWVCRMMSCPALGNVPFNGPRFDQFHPFMRFGFNERKGAENLVLHFRKEQADAVHPDTTTVP